MDAKKFAERLEKALRRNALSRRTGAERLGVGMRTLQRWCQGEVTPQPEKLAQAAEALGVSIGWLSGDEPDRIQPAPGAIESQMFQDLVKEIRAIRRKMQANEEREIRRGRQKDPANWIGIDRTLIGTSTTGSGQVMVDYLSAGLGSDVEPVDDGYIAEEFRGDSVVLARVRGESMAPTIPDRSIVVLEMCSPPIRLPSVDEVGRLPMARFRSQIPHGSVVVCSVGEDGGPTLKRVLYLEASPESGASWVVSISADNEEWAEGTKYPHWVKARESLTVHARVVALGEMED